uniref:INCENP_ARK-bind domain-containing protein n=1 Tax=Caenorhabditis tropicalis TaxID=1561998 RepID=A0A1I7UG59_9PELO
MLDWNCRETDSPLPSDITLHNLEPVKTDSGMSIATDFDDDFWDLDLYQKGRSASFGGVTQYSQQFMHQKVSIRPFFNTSLETVDSGRTRYKKSSRLESKDSEKPKRVYEVIKPVINDDFDKQMEEIRMQMKSGSNQLQNKIKDLSKGILTATEEAKTKEMEEKRRLTTEKATGAFGKAEEEKARWKASRDAEAAREYAKIEAEKHLKKKRILIDKPSGETVLNQEKAEAPKRTIRRWKPPPPDPNAVIPSFSCGPKESAKPKQETSAGKTSKPSTPTARRKSLASPVTVPKETVIPAAGIQNIPKSEGAAATRIRNQAVAAGTTIPSTQSPTPSIPSVTESPKPSRRYNARRKTQEIVNESLVKPRTQRRKRNPRKTRFIRMDRDADLLLGYAKNSTFEQLEKLFDQSIRNRRPISKFEKIRRLAPSKIFISELTDIDKIYKSSEIRDIIASVNMVY